MLSSATLVLLCGQDQVGRAEGSRGTSIRRPASAGLSNKCDCPASIKAFILMPHHMPVNLGWSRVILRRV